MCEAKNRSTSLTTNVVNKDQDHFQHQIITNTSSTTIQNHITNPSRTAIKNRITSSRHPIKHFNHQRPMYTTSNLHTRLL
jgi:hypothetical protein